MTIEGNCPGVVSGDLDLATINARGSAPDRVAVFSAALAAAGASLSALVDAIVGTATSGDAVAAYVEKWPATVPLLFGAARAVADSGADPEDAPTLTLDVVSEGPGATVTIDEATVTVTVRAVRA